MKPRLQTSLGQNLVMTPQLQQAIRLLQMSAVELEAELAAAVESNPLLDWTDHASDDLAASATPGTSTDPAAHEGDTPAPAEAAWGPDDGEVWCQRVGPAAPDSDRELSEQVAETENLQDYLLWQLHLSQLSPRERQIAVVLIEAIDDDGYFRESLDSVAATLAPELQVDEHEIVTVLQQVQRFDPAGIGARDLSECLSLQLQQLDEATPGRELALVLARDRLDRLPKIGASGLATKMKLPIAQVETAVHLLRSLEPRPGAGIGTVAEETYVSPDIVIWRQHGMWRVALSDSMSPRIGIHRGYENMIRHAGTSDANYLKGHLQEARWLLKSLEARGVTMLKVARCLISQQAGFLEFGDAALRPLTLREVAAEIGMHESTVSRAIARKYARTPRGTIPLRAFFASGIDTGGGGEASSTAIQAMLRELIDAENPRKPLADARLAETLKAAGIPVARRTVAKYREAMGITSSQDRVRMA